jgi:hypothetical protein
MPESHNPPSVDLAMNCKGNTISSGIGLTDATDSGTFPLRAFGGIDDRMKPLKPKMDQQGTLNWSSMQKFVFSECTP